MLLSSRQAAGVLLAEGGIARMQARRLLAAGLAGPRVQGTGAVLYDQTAVQTLAVRPMLDLDELATSSPHGLVIAWLNPARRIDATAGWDELATSLAVQQGCRPGPERCSRRGSRSTAHSRGSQRWQAGCCRPAAVGGRA